MYNESKIAKADVDRFIAGKSYMMAAKPHKKVLGNKTQNAGNKTQDAGNKTQNAGNKMTTCGNKT